MIYLDTHIAVWLSAGKLSKIPLKTRLLLEQSDLVISAMVVLELALLWEINSVNVKPMNIVNDLEQSIGLSVSKEDFSQIAFEAMKYSWTRDPFDRIIVAEASINKSLLISKDAKILQHYKKTVWN